MAETFTTRFGLINWGVGTDSPSRVDFNGAFQAIETRAAYDDGVTRNALPTTEVVKGRLAMTSPDGTRRTYYRRDDAGAWGFIGGTTVPVTVEHRPYSGAAAGGPATTAAALSFAHPDLTSAAGSLSWGGAARFSRSTVWDPNDSTKGTLHVGVDIDQDAVGNGRAYIRTRNSGERGLVIQPHADTAGEAFVMRNAGGSLVTTIDALGQLRQRLNSGFGGAAVAAAHAVAVAPTSNASDGVTNGLLLYGQAAPADTKTILRVQRDLADTGADLLTVGRDTISMGRVPWGSDSSGGELVFTGAQISLRANGYPSASNTGMIGINYVDPADPMNRAKDTQVVGISKDSLAVRAPLYLSQKLATGAAVATLDRYTSDSAPFLVMRRNNATETVVQLDGDGRLRTGARWLGAGTMVDARSSLKHVSRKRYAFPRTDGPTSGPSIGNSGGSLTYTFPVMQMHSVTACDLDVTGILETVFAQNNNDQGLSYFMEIYASVNGGSFTLIETSENFQRTVETTMRQTGDNFVANQWLQNVPPGATVQMRIKITNNSLAGGASMYIRMLSIEIEESLVTSYVAA